MVILLASEDALLEVRSVSRHELGGLVHDGADIRRWLDDAHGVGLGLQSDRGAAVDIHRAVREILDRVGVRGMIRWESGGWWAYRGGIWVGFRCSATARDSTIERRSMGRARTTSTTSEAVLATSIPGDPLIVADLRVSTDGLQSTRPRLTKNDVRPRRAAIYLGSTDVLSLGVASRRRSQ
ncbi:hypothetical protein CBD41_03615 [bacterium TMED181]|nr:MAG: hypothetical protein CBD41_03615 [bacterium TMED181]